MTMQVPRLHIDLPLAAGRRITLPEVAGHHVARVLRLRAGDALTVFDGRGGEYRATLARVSRAAVVADVGAHEPADRESPLVVELGQGICKGDRMDLVVQKATELGVGIIRPIVCERTVVKLDVRLDPGRAERRLAHWRAIAVHAAQQSGRTRVPEIAGIEHPDAWLARSPGAGPAFVLSPDADASLADFAAARRRRAGAPACRPRGRPLAPRDRARSSCGLDGGCAWGPGCCARRPRRWWRSPRCRRAGGDLR